MRHNNVAMVWMDNKKDIRYGPAKLDNLEMYKIYDEVENLIQKTMENRWGNRQQEEKT